MNRFWKGKRFSILFSILLTAFTAYALLDTFVIPRQYAAVDSGTVTESSDKAVSSTQDGEGSAAADNTASASGESGYEGQGTVSESDSLTLNADVPDNSAYRPKRGRHPWHERTDAASGSEGTSTEKEAEDTGNGRNIKERTSVMASENNAVLAVNGDFYGARNSGFVIRNGVLYRETGQGGEVLAIFDDGSIQIVNDQQATARELLEAGAVQVFSFGPALVKDGIVSVKEGQEVGRAMASNPRTAIGVIDTLHYVFVVADGRTERSEGMSLYQLAVFLKGIGVNTAYNLDGGGSSTMVFNGEIINHPTTTGNSVKERSVSDIVYIGS